MQFISIQFGQIFSDKSSVSQKEIERQYDKKKIKTVEKMFNSFGAVPRSLKFLLLSNQTIY